MTKRAKGPIAGAPRESSINLQDYAAIQAELQTMEPPPGHFWIDGKMPQTIREAVNLAMKDEGREDVRIYAVLDPEAAAKGWTIIRVEAGRWRIMASVTGWRPNLAIKDALWFMKEMAKAKVAMDELHDVAVDLESARHARSLLTDGRMHAAKNLRKAERTVSLMCDNMAANATSPRNWSNPIPEDAQIEGLFYPVIEDQDEA